ncbi:hypothetical protein RFI_31724, partial [Reticulomyxa filosa]
IIDCLQECLWYELLFLKHPFFSLCKSYKIENVYLFLYFEVVQKQEIAMQQVLLEQINDCFIVIRRYLNEVIRLTHLKKAAKNIDTKSLEMSNFAMAQSVNLLQISLKDCHNKKKEAIQLAQTKLTSFDLELSSLARNLEDEKEIKKRVAPILALNPGPKLNEKTLNEDTVGTNKLYNDQEKMKQNAKGAVNQMLSTKTYNLNKSSMVYDINPDYLENENFFQEKKKGILNQIGIHLLKMTPKIVLRKVVKWILKIIIQLQTNIMMILKIHFRVNEK